jgi:hypothetical protein
LTEEQVSMGIRGRLYRVGLRGLALAGVAVVAETAAQVITATGPRMPLLPGSGDGLLGASIGGLFPTTWAAAIGASALLLSGGLLSGKARNLGPKTQPRVRSRVLRKPAPQATSDRNYVKLERLLLPGERVYHPSFGTGMVVSLIRNGGDLEVRVAFDGHGVERFFAANQPTSYPVIEGGLGRATEIPDSGLRPAA